MTVLHLIPAPPQQPGLPNITEGTKRKRTEKGKKIRKANRELLVAGHLSYSYLSICHRDNDSSLSAKHYLFSCSLTYFKQLSVRKHFKDIMPYCSSWVLLRRPICQGS